MVLDGFGFNWTQGFGRAWEDHPGNVDKEGDLINNRYGAEIGQQFKEGKLSGDLGRYIEDFINNGHANLDKNCQRCTT